ncbi:general stress protein [Kocuria sp. KH4]
MSTPRSLPPASPAVRGLPRGEVIGRYGTYADAQKAVDHLADEQFEVDRIAIVGNDLKSVEQVTGRLSYPRVAGQGALNGMVFGAFLGMILSLLAGGEWVSSLLVSVLLGGAFWMLLATVTYAMQRGKRDFTSTNQIVATSYDVVAAPEVAQRARQVLQGLRGLQSLPLGGSFRPGPAQGPVHGRHPQGPGAPGAPWQRPAYGAPAAQQGPGQEGAAPQGTAPQGPADPVPGQRAEEPAPGRSAAFEDLPDGRPQYGIRLPAGEPARRDAGPDGRGAAPGSGPGEPSAGGSTAADDPR